MSGFESMILEKEIESFLLEDDLGRHPLYFISLPQVSVFSKIKIKSDLILAGLPWFIATFKKLGVELEDLKEFEGEKFKAGDEIKISKPIPLAVALSGERVALNLLQKASSIATFTSRFVEIAKPFRIKILDTRKTTPGLRNLEKYAVVKGGGYNHRMGQTDVWMVKDNHKNCFGGLKEAVDFFRTLNGFYTPIEVEIHSVEEIKMALELGIKHLMLDNFSKDQIQQAIDLKIPGVTYEISGGVNLNNIKDYCVAGIDAISIGALTYGAPPVDISFKYERKA
ncbi:MAG: carboxylating nicotinate-nucleotide diphosphorylase [Bdellovibrio sp.]